MMKKVWDIPKIIKLEISKTAAKNGEINEQNKNRGPIPVSS